MTSRAENTRYQFWLIPIFNSKKKQRENAQESGCCIFGLKYSCREILK